MPPRKGDPLNKKNFTTLPGVKLAVLELPDAPSQPWVEKKDNIPEGKLVSMRLRSAKFNDKFKIKIYLPPNYNPSTEPYGSLFLFDGYLYTNPNRIPTPTIIDNLIFSKKIPPIIAVFIWNHINKGEAARYRELHTNPDFAYFVAEELYPIPRWRFLLEKFGVYLTYNLLYPVLMIFAVVLSAIGIGESIDLATFTYSVIGVWLLFFALGALSLLCSAIFLKSKKALPAAGIVIFGQYVLVRVGGMVSNAEPLKLFSLFNYLNAGTIVSSGTMPINELLIVITVGVIALIGVLYIFQKRELAF